MSIHLVDDHARALEIWASSAPRSRTLLHVDEHLDLRPISVEKLARARAALATADSSSGPRPWDYWSPSAQKSHGCGDYLAVALHLGLLERLIWVLPPDVALPKGEPLDKEGWCSLMRQHLGCEPDPLLLVEAIGPGWMEGRLLERPFRACVLDALPPLDTPVLLDIDADFFSACYPPSHPPSLGRASRPGPISSFLSLLRERGVESELTTIARSIDGGYMPLSLDPLARDLAGLLQERSDLPSRQRLTLLQELSYLEAHELPRYEARLRQAIEAHPQEPSLHLRAAHVQARRHGLLSALGEYRQAIAIDPAFRVGLVTACHAALIQRDEHAASVLFAECLASFPNPQENHLLLIQADLEALRSHPDNARELAAAWAEMNEVEEPDGLQPGPHSPHVDGWDNQDLWALSPSEP